MDDAGRRVAILQLRRERVRVGDQQRTHHGRIAPEDAIDPLAGARAQREQDRPTARSTDSRVAHAEPAIGSHRIAAHPDVGSGRRPSRNDGQRRATRAFSIRNAGLNEGAGCGRGFELRAPRMRVQQRSVARSPTCIVADGHECARCQERRQRSRRHIAPEPRRAARGTRDPERARSRAPVSSQKPSDDRDCGARDERHLRLPPVRPDHPCGSSRPRAAALQFDDPGARSPTTMKKPRRRWARGVACCSAERAGYFRGSSCLGLAATRRIASRTSTAIVALVWSF